MMINVKIFQFVLFGRIGVRNNADNFTYLELLTTLRHQLCTFVL